MPVSRCLTRSACAHADAVRRIRDDIGDDTQWLAALGAALLLERASFSANEKVSSKKNENASSETTETTIRTRYARLSGYVATLPRREANVVASWPEERRRFLAGTDVERALRCERSAARREWEGYAKTRVREALAARRETFRENETKRETAKEGDLITSFPTFRDYLDARSVVSSRAFLVTDAEGPGLVPIADLFNHRTGGHHVAMRLLDGEKNGASSTSDATLVAVVSSRAEKGAEVFNTYGALGNATLLNSYGFTQENNPEDTVSVSVPDVRAAAAMRGAPGPVVAKRLAACFSSRRAPFQEHALFPLRKTRSLVGLEGSPLEPPTALLVALWAVTATDEAFASAEREIAGETAGLGGSGHPAEEAGRDAAAAAAAALWRAAAERAEVSGTIFTAAASEVFLEILDRRRRMYVDVPEDYREDDSIQRDAETGGWRASLRILVESERAVVDAHAAETKRRLAAFRGEFRADELDDAKRRKTAVVAEAEDPFALFD